MIIADTSIWIEYLRGNEEYQDMLNAYLDKREVIAVSAVFGELLQGCRAKREKSIINRFWQNLPKINESDLFIEAGKLSNDYGLIQRGVGLIDAYIFVAALNNDLFLWTIDKKLQQVIDEIF
ncbi:MAG: PIN domain-containing protein [Bacteroidota bacterium]